MPIIIILLIIIFFPTLALVGGYGLGVIIIFGIPILLVVLGVLWLLLQPIIFISEYKERKQIRERKKRDRYNRKHGIVSDEQFDELQSSFRHNFTPLQFNETYQNMTKVQKRKVLNKLEENYRYSENLKRLKILLEQEK